MPFGSLRSKSKPPNVRGPAPTDARDGQVSSYGIPNPRPRSSVYSQPSISEFGGYTDPFAPPIPELPAAHYTRGSLAPQPLHPQRRARSEMEEPESPGGTRSFPKHTPVSEYLKERAWMPQTPRTQHHVPMPLAPSPPVPESASSIRKRFSISSDRFTRRGSRQTSLSRSNTTSLEDDEYADRYDRTERKESLSLSTPAWVERRRSTITTLPTPATPYADSPTIGTPYEQTRQGAAPHMVHSSRNPISPALLRGFSKRYQKGALVTPAAPIVPRSRPAIYYRTETMKHSGGRKFMHPALRNGKVLKTRTRDPVESSEQASWLFLGTMRGPTPGGVREIDAIMGKAMAKGKEKSIQNAIKDIRRLTDNTSRSTVEWVEVYVHRKWGIELYAS